MYLLNPSEKQESYSGQRPIYTSVYSFVTNRDMEISQLIQKQRELAERVILQDEFTFPPATIAGGDVTFLDIRKTLTTAIASFVVLSFPDLKILEQKTAVERVSFPYIPGLLAFRELSPLLSVYRKLSRRPDVCLIDGQGIAHPRYLGIASHFGLEADSPTIGCAKKLLFGSFDPPSVAAATYGGAGSPEVTSSPLWDKKGMQIGNVLRPKGGQQLLFISPGHKISLKSATEIIKNTLLYSIPEPTRLAHNLLQEERRKLLKRKNSSPSLF